MKIVNKRRFTMFIILVILIGVLVFSMISQVISFATNGSELTEREIMFLDNYEHIQVFIKTGDTSWDIQNELTPNSDIRRLLYYLGKLNNRNMGIIKPGEELIFLQKKD